MPTLVELAELAGNIETCRELGLSFVELNMNLPAFQMDKLDATALTQARAQHNVEFTVHLPEILDLATFQHEIRKGCVEFVLRAIEWARQAGVTKLTMHMNPGVYFTMPNGKVWLYEKHRDPYRANLLASMDRLAASAADAGIVMLVENSGDFVYPFVRDAVETMLSRYGRQVGLTWDFGHDAQSKGTDGEFIRRHIDRVAHLHLHDFDGRSAHKELFTGSVDVEAAINFARERNLAVILETKTLASLTASLETLRSRRPELRDFIPPR